jgi:hypothetical protein
MDMDREGLGHQLTHHQLYGALELSRLQQTRIFAKTISTDYNGTRNSLRNSHEILLAFDQKITFLS